MNDSGTRMRTMCLTGYGRLAWANVERLLAGLSCAWADYEGFHVGRPCPGQAPPYSHLWAWNDDATRLVRVRVDGDEGIVGELTNGSPLAAGGGGGAAASSGAAAAVGGCEQVEVRVSPGFCWGDDPQLGRRLEQDVAQGRFTLYEPLLPLSATFVSWKAPAR